MPPQMLELVRADCEQLLASTTSTAELATHISSKVCPPCMQRCTVYKLASPVRTQVRCLDTAQNSVSAVLSKISLILDCSSAISGVQSAMQAEVRPALRNTAKQWLLPLRWSVAVNARAGLPACLFLGLGSSTAGGAGHGHWGLHAPPVRGARRTHSYKGTK
jgi:hypothetical protein